MQEFPHQYAVCATGEARGDVELTSPNLPALQTATPPQFDGQDDRWSPETLLVGAIGDCFVLTFRGVARASRLDWSSVRCDVTGTLERVDRVAQFTRFEITVHVEVPTGASAELAHRVIDKAERSCLVSNSLKGAVHLVPHVHTTDPIAELSVA